MRNDREKAGGSRQQSRNAQLIRPLLLLMCALVPGMALAAGWGSYPAHAACANCETIDTSPTAALTLDGTDRRATYMLSLTVNNLGVTGWNVTITSTPFTTSG